MDELARPRILHLHSGFNLGGKEARAVRLMNIWGENAHHTIVSADHDAMGAAKAIAQNVFCDFPMDAAPSLHGLPEPRRYWRWARYMQGFDLVLTYNWGAMDAVMAHRMFSPFLKLPALIHHEDGFNEDEAERLKPKRNHFRRLALARAYALAVPSQLLQGIARDVWHQPENRVKLIFNGIDVDAYAEPPARDAIPGFAKEQGRVTIGTLAGLRAVKNLPLLVRALASLKNKVQLVIVGEGPERGVIEQQARAAGFDALVMPGFLSEPSRYIGLFDIFALSSDSEQFPISLVEAMAAGLPAVSTNVGDVTSMVSAENRPYIVPKADEVAMTGAFAELINHPDMRQSIGTANRKRAEQEYREADMVNHYAALYGAAMKRPQALTGHG